MKKSLIIKEKTAALMIMIVIISMVGLIWACATEPVTKEIWSKPNAMQKEFAKDKYECIKDTNGTADHENAKKDIVKNVELYNSCMEARGWKLKEVKSVSDNLNSRETYAFADGTKYEGSIVKGKMQGIGTYTWANGSKYEGDWVDGKMNGIGTYTCDNGIKFTGNFENNKPVGFTVKCTTLQKSGNVSASRNTMSGYKGSYKDANGNKFEGNIVNGKLHGKGTITSPSGNKYEGDFVNGKIDGWGTYTCSNGKQFTGNFKDNKPVGFTVKCN